MCVRRSFKTVIIWAAPIADPLSVLACSVRSLVKAALKWKRRRIVGIYWLTNGDAALSTIICIRAPVWFWIKAEGFLELQIVRNTLSSRVVWDGIGKEIYRVPFWCTGSGWIPSACSVGVVRESDMQIFGMLVLVISDYIIILARKHGWFGIVLIGVSTRWLLFEFLCCDTLFLLNVFLFWTS